jgi:hypothetical protein
MTEPKNPAPLAVVLQSTLPDFSIRWMLRLDIDQFWEI